MNLDDLSLLPHLDPQNTLADIEALPAELEAAWERGQGLPLPLCSPNTRQVVIAALGVAAQAADLLSALSADACSLPVIVHRDYGLPAFAAGPETLVVVASVAGDDEESLDTLETALTRRCSILTLSAGGMLAERAASTGVTHWAFSLRSLPSAAVAPCFGLLLALFTRCGWLADPSSALTDAIQAMREQQQNLSPQVPAALNPAKRYAGQLVGRWVTVFGAGALSAVARRWKTQINELAKAPASFEFLPEADHNALAALVNPADLLQSRTLVMFLLSPSDHPRNRLRSELTRQVFMLEGSNTDFYMAKGKSKIAHLWTALHFGDYLAWYLALAYQTNPAPVESLTYLKETLASQRTF